MFRNRRFACLFLGLWLGGSVAVDLLVIENSSVVDSFIASPGSASAAAQVKQAGQKTVRFIMHRNAAEENAEILQIWEWSQIGIAIFFLLMILFGDRPPMAALVLVPAMLVIVLLQRFVLTPNLVSLGRELDEMPARELLNNPTVGRFWAFHGIYTGSEIFKLLMGIGVGVRLMVRRIADSTKEHDREVSGSKESAQRSHSGERVRKRPKTDHDG